MTMNRRPHNRCAQALRGKSLSNGILRYVRSRSAVGSARYSDSAGHGCHGSCNSFPDLFSLDCLPAPRAVQILSSATHDRILRGYFRRPRQGDSPGVRAGQEFVSISRSAHQVTYEPCQPLPEFRYHDNIGSVVDCPIIDAFKESDEKVKGWRHPAQPQDFRSGAATGQRTHLGIILPNTGQKEEPHAHK